MLVSSGAIAAGLAPLGPAPAAPRTWPASRPPPASARACSSPATPPPSPATAYASARCCSPPTTPAAAPTTATPTGPWTSCSPWAPSRSSTRTTPSPRTRSASATTTGSPPSSPTSSAPTCWSSSPTSTASTTATRPGPAPRGSTRSAARTTSRTSQIGSAGKAGRRHRRHGHQGRGGPDRRRRRRPRRPHLRQSAPPTPSPGRATGTYFHRTGRRSADRLLWLAHASTPQGALTLDDGAVRAVVRAAAARCCRPGSPRSRASSAPGDPVELRDTDGPRRRPRARQLRRQGDPAAARPLDPRAGPGARARRTSARSYTGTIWSSCTPETAESPVFRQRPSRKTAPRPARGLVNFVAEAWRGTAATTHATGGRR